jgi:hypothetical protein
MTVKLWSRNRLEQPHREKSWELSITFSTVPMASTKSARCSPSSSGGSAMASIMRMSAVQLYAKYLASGVVTGQDLDQDRRFSKNPRTRVLYYATVAVSGRQLSG